MKLSKLTATLLCLATAVVLYKACSCASFSHAAIQDHRHSFEYKLTGTSDLTHERVIAYMDQDKSDPSRLTGIIHDTTKIYHVHGIWRGRGLVLAKSIISTYHLEVVK